MPKRTRWGEFRSEYVLAVVNSDGDPTHFWREPNWWTPFIENATRFTLKDAREAAHELLVHEEAIGVFKIDGSLELGWEIGRMVGMIYRDELNN